MTMWRDGARLWTESPRNFIFGIGMDSKEKHWQEWQMFDGGRLPMGHFHSTYFQLAVERGLPALLIWRGLRTNQNGDWRNRGIMLGSLGGMVGFATSGFVHSNIIDAVVVLLFYLIMGLAVRSAEFADEEMSAVS